jgi:hypothetical protein
MVFAHELGCGHQTGVFVSHGHLAFANIARCQLFAHLDSLKLNM